MSAAWNDNCLMEAEDGTLLAVKVAPGARKARVGPVVGGRLRVAVTAPPKKGKANKELVRLLAKKLDLRKSDVSIKTGETAREKLLILCGITPEEVRERLGIE